MGATSSFLFLVQFKWGKNNVSMSLLGFYSSRSLSSWGVRYLHTGPGLLQASLCCWHLRSPNITTFAF